MGLQLNSHAGRGKALENMVTLSQRGIISVTKQDARARCIRRGGESLWIRQKGDVDFTGSVCSTGRAICFDAKECKERSGWSSSMLSEHQLRYLVRSGDAKAIAGVLLHGTHPDVGMYFWLPWTHLPRLWPERIGWADERLVELGGGDGIIDFRRVPGVIV